MLAGSGLGSLGLQRIEGDFDQLVKSRGIRGRDIGEDLAIERHLGRLESFHEAAVSGPSRARCRVDADLPQRPEGALFSAAVPVSVLSAVIHSIGSVAIKLRAPHPEAFGGPDHPCPAFAGSGSVCYSHKI